MAKLGKKSLEDEDDSDQEDDIADIKAQCLVRRGAVSPKHKAGDSSVCILHCKARTYMTP